jgi:putative transposase
MPGPKAPLIELSTEEHTALEQLVRRHSTEQQLALRARIVLASAAGRTNSQIAREEGAHVETVRQWRLRWLSLQAVPLGELSAQERLEDLPRSGAPPTLTAEQVSKIVALACEAPTKSGRPISQWTGREIADEIKKRGIVEQISPRHARRLLKRGICSHTAFATG